MPVSFRGTQKKRVSCSDSYLEFWEKTTFWDAQRQHEVVSLEQKWHRVGFGASEVVLTPDLHGLSSKAQKDPEVPMRLHGEQANKLKWPRVVTKSGQVMTLVTKLPQH